MHETNIMLDVNKKNDKLKNVPKLRGKLYFLSHIQFFKTMT